MTKLPIIAAVLLALPTVSIAAEYPFDGMLEEGDMVLEQGGWADAYPFDGQAGDEVGFRITGMDGVPHGAVFDASGKSLYSSWGITGELLLKFKVPADGSYTFYVTQRNKVTTPYHLVVMDLPPGSVLD